MSRRFVSKALVPAGLAYSVLMHLAIRNGVTDSGHLTLLSLPLLVGAGWLVMRSVSAHWRPLVVLAFGALFYGLTQGSYLRSGMIAADGLTHAFMNFFMLWFFGSTLRQGSR